jgi:hypothetical protein
MPTKETDLVPIGNAQADINIFTVASGLLYEVRDDSFFQRSSFTKIFHMIAFRIDYDSQRFTQHEEQRQILVHRKFSVPFVPRE